MLRLSLALLVCTAACADPEFTELHVEFYPDDDELSVWLPAPGDRTPCPSLGVDGEVLLNGNRGSWYAYGGEDGDPDGAFYGCEDVEVLFPRVPLSDGAVEVVVDGGGLHVEARVEFVSRVWTDDDVVAAYTAGEPVRVNWTPVDLPAPRIAVTYSGGTLTVTAVDDGLGSALIDFVGATDDPSSITLTGEVDLAAGPMTCAGIAECTFGGDLPFVVEAPAP